jgi:serine/threonine protein kinase
MNEKPKIIGQGGFGVVTEEGGLAKKKFERLHHMIRELAMLRYMRHSGYIVKVEKQNFKAMTISCKKWHCCLHEAMVKKRIPAACKLQIFKDVLYGLCHIHEAGIVHSDITPGNILVNTKSWKACLCDLGLSSITNYCRVYQTAEGYAPEKPVPCPGHDMFGLAVSMIGLFGNTPIYKKKTARELREIITNHPAIPDKLKKVLCRMCPDDPRKAITSKEVLWTVFQEKTSFDLPEVELYEVTVPDETKQYIQEKVAQISKIYKINREQRCYSVLLQFFSGPEGQKAREECYDLFIVSALYIFACLYGRSYFTKEEALKTLRGDYSEEDLLIVAEMFVQDNNFITMTLVSTK